jgi:hypothetical protein
MRFAKVKASVRFARTLVARPVSIQFIQEKIDRHIDCVSAVSNDTAGQEKDYGYVKKLRLNYLGILSGLPAVRLNFNSDDWASTAEWPHDGRSAGLFSR